MDHFDIYKDGHNFKLIYFVFDHSIKHSKAHGHVGNESYKHALIATYQGLWRFFN